MAPQMQVLCLISGKRGILTAKYAKYAKNGTDKPASSFWSAMFIESPPFGLWTLDFGLWTLDYLRVFAIYIAAAKSIFEGRLEDP